MSRAGACCVAVVFAMVVGSGCGGSSEGGAATEIASYPLDDVAGVIDAETVELDGAVTSDGAGSLRIDTTEPVVVRLFETGDVDVERVSLSYSAMIRTEALDGVAYLEMWCDFPDESEYFSRALQSPPSGDSDWASQETLFLLQEGQNPSNVRLNLVVEGAGTVWIDDMKLLAVQIPGTQ